MPFAEGNNANPGGRPKGSKGTHAARLARNHDEAAIDVLVALLKSENETVRGNAANSILDRGYGKPKEFVELSGDEDNPIRAKITVELIRGNQDTGSV
jgi:HEAT repeat protein